MPHSRTVRSVQVPRLRFVRLWQALSQDALAERAGVGRMTIQRAEKGASVRLSNVRKLARALRVKPEDLIRPLGPEDNLPP